MKSAAALMVAACASGALAQTPPVVWQRQFGSLGLDVATSAAPDGTGGAFIGGRTSGALFGASEGGYDVFLMRVDRNGAPVWARQFGSGTDDHVRAMTSDGAGGFYLTGYTSRAFFGPGFGHEDVILARFDGDGAPLWTRQFGSDLADGAYAVVADQDGVFVAGSTAGALGGPPAIGSDAFVARYTHDGRQTWVKRFGAFSGGDQATALAPDGAGGVFVTGWTSGNMAGPLQGGSDAFLVRLDRGGALLWTRQFGATTSDAASALTPDDAGGVFVGGILNLSAFVARYDGAGTQTWLTPLGLGYDSNIVAMVPDGAGGVIGGGWKTVPPGGAIGYDMLLTRVNGAGSLVWSRTLGSAFDDRLLAMCTDGEGGVLASGMTQGSVALQNAGGYDALIVRAAGAVCYANCDGSTGVPALNVADFTCFLGRFAAGDAYANCDQSQAPPTLNVADFTCFLQSFAAGCP